MLAWDLKEQAHLRNVVVYGVGGLEDKSVKQGNYRLACTEQVRRAEQDKTRQREATTRTAG